MSTVVRIVTFFVLWRVSVGEFSVCRLNVTDSELNADQLGEFTISFLRRFQWGNTIILTSKHGDGLVRKFSINYVRVAVQPSSANLSKVDGFRSVMLIGNRKTAFDVLSRVLANPVPPTPENWLLITNEAVIEQSLLFIPHDYHIVFATPILENPRCFKQMQLLRPYSLGTRQIATKVLGSWNPNENVLNVTFVPSPLPLLTGNVIRITTTTVSNSVTSRVNAQKSTYKYFQFEPHFGLNYLQPPDGGKPYGIFGEILHILRTKMNFTYTVTPPKNKQFGNRINETYSTGMVGHLGANKSDVSVAITMSLDRKTVIDYSHMVTRIYAKFVYRNRESVRWRFFFFREPFSHGLWASIVVIGIIVAIFFSLVNEDGAINNARSLNPRRNCARFKSFTWYIQVSFFTLLRTGFDLNLSRTANKIVLQVFHFFSIIIFVQYSTVLTSMLTVNNKPVPFRSLEELLDKSDYGLGTLLGTSMVEYYKSSKTGINKRVWQRMQRGPRRFITSTSQGGIDLAYEENYAYLMDSLVLATIIKGNCSLQFGDETAYDVALCLGYRRGFLFKKAFDNYLQLMRENGVVQKIEKKYTPPNHNRACGSRKWHMGLERHSLVGIFVVMSLAIVLALFTLCVEIIIWRTYFLENFIS